MATIGSPAAFASSSATPNGSNFDARAKRSTLPEAPARRSSCRETDAIGDGERAPAVRARSQRSVTRDRHAQARHARRGGREGVQLRRVILLFHQASDTADDDIVGSKAELSSKLRHALRGDAIDGPQVCGVGDHAKLVERHAVVPTEPPTERRRDGDDEPHHRCGKPVPVHVAPRSGREWLRQEPCMTGRAPGTRRHSEIRPRRGCRSLEPRALRTASGAGCSSGRSAFTDQASRASRSTAPGSPSRQHDGVKGTRAASSCPTSGLPRR